MSERVVTPDTFDQIIWSVSGDMTEAIDECKQNLDRFWADVGQFVSAETTSTWQVRNKCARVADYAYEQLRTTYAATAQCLQAELETATKNSVNILKSKFGIDACKLMGESEKLSSTDMFALASNPSSKGLFKHWANVDEWVEMVEDLLKQPLIGADTKDSLKRVLDKMGEPDTVAAQKLATSFCAAHVLGKPVKDKKAREALCMKCLNALKLKDGGMKPIFPVVLQSLKDHAGKAP